MPSGIEIEVFPTVTPRVMEVRLRDGPRLSTISREQAVGMGLPPDCYYATGVLAFGELANLAREKRPE